MEEYFLCIVIQFQFLVNLIICFQKLGVSLTTIATEFKIILQKYFGKIIRNRPFGWTTVKIISENNINCMDKQSSCYGCTLLFTFPIWWNNSNKSDTLFPSFLNLSDSQTRHIIHHPCCNQRTNLFSSGHIDIESFEESIHHFINW